MILKKKDVITILLCVIMGLLTPPVLSVFIHLPKFEFIAGNENSWIGFWGSYIGALFTLLALYITIQSNKNESEQQRHIDYNKQYMRDISDAICSLSISKIIDCYMQDRDEHLITSIDCTRLEAFELDVSNCYNTFLILYPEGDEAFIEQYMKTKDL